MNIPPELLTLIGLLTGGSGGAVLITKAILDYKSGISKREKEYNKETIDNLKLAQTTLEIEIHFRRAYQEYASELVSELLLQGVDKADIPDPPTRPSL